MTKAHQPSPIRYFKDSDNSGHEYLIPSSRLADWLKWRDLDEDDENAWEAPDYTIRVEGELLEFENPTLDGEPI